MKEFEGLIPPLPKSRRVARRWAVLFLAILGPTAALRAQSNYATPYTITTFAGTAGKTGSSDGTGSAALFDNPTNVALDSSGNLYVSDSDNNTIRKIAPSGAVTTLAGTPGSPGSSDGSGGAAQFNSPAGLAVDASGNVYVADSLNSTIRIITPAGVVTTFAGTPGAQGTTDATGKAARFDFPIGVALDASGNVYVADSGNETIRKISPSGAVTTLAGTPTIMGAGDGTGKAAQFDNPAGVAVDGSGNVFVADSGNGTIRKITPAGVVTTLAGAAIGSGGGGSAAGTGTAALFDDPTGVALDGSGNIYVADSRNNLIRKMTPAGVVTTLAGTAHIFGSTNGIGPAALFSDPTGVAADSAGNIYIADTANSTIRQGTSGTTVASTPTITQQPVSQTISRGSTVVFAVSANGSPLPSYQWFLNGVPVAQGTSSTLVINDANSADGGNYTCTATNSSGSATSNVATLGVVATSNPGRLVNISCRSTVGTGANILIAGFVVGGTGTAGSVSLLIRASGPALVPFGVSGTLPDPQLQLYSGSTVLGSNDGWAGSDQISSTAAAVGAFAWSDTSSHDAALLEMLTAGAYTAQIAGESADTGIALAEIYDATPAGMYTLANPRIVNISARVQVGTGGNILIAGFAIGGATSKTVLIRASGPALAPFGVTGTLPDPRLQLYSGPTLLDNNNGWGGNAQISATAASVGAFTWSSPTSGDSAILVTLPPGAYTAQVSGASGDTGVALVEVYEVP